jgi:hypothetical protein
MLVIKNAPKGVIKWRIAGADYTRCFCFRLLGPNTGQNDSSVFIADSDSQEIIKIKTMVKIKVGIIHKDKDEECLSFNRPAC